MFSTKKPHYLTLNINCQKFEKVEHENSVKIQ